MARKLCVAIWHLLMGHPIGALEPVARLSTKLAKLATELGLPEIKAQGYQSKPASSSGSSWAMDWSLVSYCGAPA